MTWHLKVLRAKQCVDCILNRRLIGHVFLSCVMSKTTFILPKLCDAADKEPTLKADDATAIIDLGPEEFAFFPVKGGVGLEATADTAACVLEYGYWTKS